MLERRPPTIIVADHVDDLPWYAHGEGGPGSPPHRTEAFVPYDLGDGVPEA